MALEWRINNCATFKPTAGDPEVTLPVTCLPVDELFGGPNLTIFVKKTQQNREPYFEVDDNNRRGPITRAIIEELTTKRELAQLCIVSNVM